MDGVVSPEELEAALASNDLLTTDPSQELDENSASWKTRAQRLRGHLSIRLEFALALAAHPGADASSDTLEEALSQLQGQYKTLQATFLGAAELNPNNVAAHRPEAFRISRLASRWACRLWIWERCRGVSLSDDFVKRVLSGFEAAPTEGEETTQTRSIAATTLGVIAKVVDATARFDFLHKDRDQLLHTCVEKIYESARRAVQSQPLDVIGEEGYFEAVLNAATDVFIAVYLQEARAFQTWLLSAPEEEAAHRLYVAKIVGGLDMGPVNQRFESAFEFAMSLTSQKSGASWQIVRNSVSTNYQARD